MRIQALRYVVRKGDCLWHLSNRYYGSPWHWQRIYTYNNRESIIALTGRGIRDADLIYIGQVLYLPDLNNLLRPQLHEKPAAARPINLNMKVRQSNVPFAAAFKLDEFPLMVYEDVLIKATIKTSGKVAIRLAEKVPLIHATNRGLEAKLSEKAEAVVHQLFTKEAKVEWNNHTKKITYRCMLTANSTTPTAPSTAVGLAVASGKPVPVIRGEIRYPKLSGTIDGNLYVTEDVSVVVEVEPKVPPMANEDQRVLEKPIVDRQTDHLISPPNNDIAWKMIGEGAMVLSVTLLADFCLGIGLIDDVVTIPMALSRMGSGASRLYLPVIVRRAARHIDHRTACVTIGMALKAIN